MKMKAILLAALAFQIAVSSGGEKQGPEIVVYLRPEMSQFWSTATNSTVALPIDFPDGVESATLEVSGSEYFRSYQITSPEDCILQLPEPDSLRTENVYDLKLTCSDGTVRTARLGCVMSYSSGACAKAACILSSESSKWNKIKHRSVIQIPYGMTSFAYQVNGGDVVEVDTGSGKAASWHALGPVKSGDQISLESTMDDAVYDAFLLGKGEGLLLHLR